MSKRLLINLSSREGGLPPLFANSGPIEKTVINFEYWERLWRVVGGRRCVQAARERSRNLPQSLKTRREFFRRARVRDVRARRQSLRDALRLRRARRRGLR